MNKPDFKLTFIQLLMLCIAIMLYVFILDGKALCMHESELAQDPDIIDSASDVKRLERYTIGLVVVVIVAYRLIKYIYS